MTSSPRFTDAAHDCARRGWRVIPLHNVGLDGLTCSCRKGRKCTSKGKHPLDNGWSGALPLSGPDIEATWEERPKANLGLATGESFWVLDIDPKSGGLESAKQLQDAFGAFGHLTYTVITGSGGYHLYWALPDFPVTNARGRLKDFPGIDVRGIGGQVVAPPSRTDLGDYSIPVERDIAAAPEWLLDMIRPETRPDQAPVQVVDRSHLDAETIRSVDAYAHAAINSELARLDAMAAAKAPDTDDYRGEPWNETTFVVACALTRLANSSWCALTHDSVESLVMGRAPQDESFTAAEIATCLASARTSVGDDARPMPAGPIDEVDLFGGPQVRDLTTSPAKTKTIVVPPDSPQASLADHGIIFDPGAYFLPGIGLNVAHLATDINRMGEVAWGIDGAFWSYADGIWKADPRVIQRRVGDLLGGRFRTSHVSNVKDYLTPRSRMIRCDPVETHINTRNGMLDWRTGMLEPWAEHFMSTVQVHVDYDPDALCPEFDKFLARVLPADYIEMAWEMIGYMMFSGNPLQVAFLLYGGGSNGKGTLIRVIEGLLGEENYANESLDMLNNNRFSSFSLFGKIANIAGDIDATYQESTAMFKKLTGEDTIAAERKFGDRFVFKNWAVPVFSANKIPGSADVTEGYLRRWVVFSFPEKFTAGNKILSYSDHLLEERQGIFTKAIPALRRLMERKHFSITGDAAAVKDEFAEAVDQVRQWISDQTVMAPEHFEIKRVLYDSYRAWAEREHTGRLGSKEFYHRLESIGYKPSIRNGNRGFIGLVPAHTLITKTHEGFFTGIES